MGKRYPYRTKTYPPFLVWVSATGWYREVHKCVHREVHRCVHRCVHREVHRCVHREVHRCAQGSAYECIGVHKEVHTGA